MPANKITIAGMARSYKSAVRRRLYPLKTI
jgi:hypothetical protein